ncbi:MAG: hypothetical protein JXX28_12680 [Deltaproteobacteria bacterium]|nr:hypothetical protein [Deltaproteobacteria bacterium]
MRDGELSAWLDAPPCAEVGSAAWKAQLARLAAEGSLGRALASRGLSAVTEGPGYLRATLDGSPPLSLVFLPDGCLRSVEITYCVDCDEPRRFVEDLLAAAAAGQRGLLLPGDTLDLSAWTAQHPALEDRHWTGTLHTRNERVAAQLIAGMTLLDVDGDQATLARADGREERWKLLVRDGRWQLSYADLPDDSPLRMSRDEEQAWTRASYRAQQATARWSPGWTERDAALRVGARVLGGAIHPLDDTIALVAVDLDRELSALFRVDPDLRAVLEREPLPISTENPLPLDRWFASWPAALSPDQRRLALSAPGKLWWVDLEEGSRRQLLQGAPVRHLAWGQGGGLLAAQEHALALVADSAVRWRVPVSAPPVAVSLGRVAYGLLTSGALLVFDTAEGTEEETLQACDQRALDGAISPDGMSFLAVCVDGDSASASLLDLAGGGRRALGGPVGAGRGVSWSPDGLLATTPSYGGGTLVWDMVREEPLADLPSHDAQAVRWSGTADRLMILEGDGEAWLWRRPTPSRAPPGGG